MAGKEKLATAKWRAMADLQLDERGATTYDLPFTLPSAFTFASCIIYAAFVCCQFSQHSLLTLTDEHRATFWYCTLVYSCKCNK